jgi:hypothetical protein
MGAWGTGLYSGDLASDLRIAVAAVARLPFEGERLLGLLCDTEPSAALDPKDPDHTAFWLVCADQFAKRGIVCSSVLEAALAIIDQDRDPATFPCARLCAVMVNECSAPRSYKSSFDRLS